MQKSIFPSQVFIAGNPNSGKTTLFNLLTGLRHKTANYPGVTVESKAGKIKLLNEKKEFVYIECSDLPGIYGMEPASKDEEVAVEAFHKALTYKDQALLLYVIDSTNFPRSLPLLLQLKSMGFKIAVLLNMYDLARNKGYSIDDKELSRILHMPVLKSDKRGIAIAKDVKDIIGQYGNIDFNADGEQEEIQVSDIVKQCFSQPKINWSTYIQSADKILLHPIFGPLIFFVVMALVFQSIFSWSALPMDLIENLMAFAGSTLYDILPPGILRELLVKGVLTGISGVLVFIPQIAFLFFFIAIMEESGYLARISFLFDRIMHKFGLNGRSTIALIGGAACAVPSILSARTISNKKERLITIFVTPFISCSARLPVYAVLIGFVVPDKSWYFFNLQGLVLLFLYFLGIFAAFLTAFILHIFIKSEEKSFLILEMPFYKRPSVSQIIRTVWGKVHSFVSNAGKIILAISIVLWFLASYGPGDKMQSINIAYEKLEQTEENAARMQAEKLENSYAGMMGKYIEPLMTPLGFDWKIGVALITSFAAREVFVGTMSTLYSVGSEDEKKLSEKLALQKRADGSPMYTPGVSMALLLFYVFALQCMSTLAVVKKETESWKIPLMQFIFMGALAYLSAWLAYTLI